MFRNIFLRFRRGPFFTETVILGCDNPELPRMLKKTVLSNSTVFWGQRLFPALPQVWR